MKNFIKYIKENKNSNINDELFDAISCGRYDWVEECIKAGADVNAINYKTGNSVLILCVLKSTIDILELILKQPNININYQDEKGLTAIEFALINGHLDEALILLKHPKIDITLKNRWGQDFSYYVSNFLTLLQKKEFRDYLTQKEIIKNGREDIILTLDKYDLVHPAIKDIYPDIFKAADWGLVGQ